MKSNTDYNKLKLLLDTVYFPLSGGRINGKTIFSKLVQFIGADKKKTVSIQNGMIEGANVSYFGVCNAEQASRQYKEVSIQGVESFSLRVGTSIAVKFATNNSYSATAAAPIALDVNNTGPKNIYYDTGIPTGTDSIAFGKANITNFYMYDGTYWVCVGSGKNTTYNVVSKTSNGLAPQLPDETTTTKYFRQDGSWEVPPDNNTWPDNATYKSKMLDFCYPVGSIYVSTKNVSPATFLGGTWISLSGYMLRGATSGVTANNNAKDGGADTVTLTGAQSGIQKHTHGFTQPTVNGGATNTGGMSANNPHGHNSNDYTNGYAAHKTSTAGGRSAAFTNVGQGELLVYQNPPTANIAHTHSQVAHTHTVSGGAVSEKAATNATSSFSNIPNYKNVYMWERTA